jgi:tetratricopeptide (TPR) repeat protein
VARFGLAAVLATFTVGPAGCGLFRAPLQAPEQGGAPWTELRSEHFVLYTDAPLDEARTRIAHFETLRLALEEAAFPPSGAPERRVEVVLFEDPRDYAALAPRATTGVFYPQLPMDLERQPTLLVSGGWTDETQRRFVHEMVHELMHRAFGETPGWLNEGLAEYFSTMRIDAGQIVLGGAVPERALPQSMLPSVAEITTAGRETFSSERTDLVTVQRFYTGAWLLVHLLRNGPDRYRERFDVLARALNQEGQRFDEAWRLAMQGLDDATFERDFAAHAGAWEWSMFGRSFDPRPTSEPATRTLRPAEVHLLWASLAHLTASATSEIAKAEALEPNDPDVAYARGRLALAFGHHAEARDAFRRAQGRAPGDPRYAFALAMALATEPFGTDAHGVELARICQGLVSTARAPEEKALVAGFLLQTGRPDDARERAEEAFRADRRCALCAKALAAVLAAKGDVAGAVVVIERALSVSMDGPFDRTLLADLEKYRALARGAHPPAPGRTEAP